MNFFAAAKIHRPKKVALIIAIVFLVALGANVGKAQAISALWVNSETGCPNIDPETSVSCGVNYICGWDGASGLECASGGQLLTSLLASPLSTNNAASRVSGSWGTDGGKIYNCYQTPMDVAVPYCDLSGQFYCNPASSCLTNHVQTKCNAGTWAGPGAWTCDTATATSTTGCVTGYANCDAVNTVCEVQVGVTTCTMGDGGPGKINSSCVCVADPPVNFQTGVKAQYSTANPLLWGVQFGSGDLVRMTTNQISTSSFVVTNAGAVGIGMTSTTAPSAAAALDVSSTNKGILLPRLSGIQRDALSLATGLLVFNTDTNRFEYYTGTGWSAVGSGATSSFIFDADGNTGIMVEQSANDNNIRFLTEGVGEIMNINTTTGFRWNVPGGNYNFNVAASGSPNAFFVNGANGYVGIGTNTPAAKFTIIDGAMLLSGTTGTTPVSGAGTRLMWIPGKAAFRAGIVDGTQWDDANIGLYSAAFGSSTIASGIGSAAFGEYNTAAGMYSFAAGAGNQAGAQFSAIVGGANNIISSGGKRSFIGGGASNQTDANYSFIAGGANNIITSGGTGGFVAGAWNYVSNNEAVAMGLYATSTGLASFAAGDNVQALGDYSVAFGSSTISSGFGSFTAGEYNNNAAPGGVAFGFNNSLSDHAWGSFVSGLQNQIIATSGWSFIAGGSDNIIGDGGDRTFATGEGNFASNTASVVMGIYSTSTGDTSFAFGSHVQALGQYSGVFGASNTVSGVASFIGGGIYNQNDGSASFIAGGMNNVITSGGGAAFISGINNYVDNIAVAMGANNTSTAGASFALGRYTQALTDESFAMGDYVVVDNGLIGIGKYLHSQASGSWTFGTGVNSTTPLTNNVADSLIIGFNSTAPTLFVGPGQTTSTSGYVGINTTTPGYMLTVIGNSYTDATATLNSTLQTNSGRFLSMVNLVQGKNLLGNPSFENGTSYWTGASNQGVSLPLYTTSSDSVYGSNSLYITNPVTIAISDWMPVPPDTAFTASFWARDIGDAPLFYGMSLFADVDCGPGNQYAYNFTSSTWNCMNMNDLAPNNWILFPTSSSWVNYAATVTSTNTSTYLGKVRVFYYSLRGSGEPPVEVLFDGMQVELGSATTSFDPGTTDGGTAYALKLNQDYNNWTGNLKVFSVQDNSNRDFLRLMGDGTMQLGSNDIHGQLEVYNAASSPSFVVNHLGNVGIGTASPAASLYVNGNSYTEATATFNSVVQSNFGQFLSMTNLTSGVNLLKNSSFEEGQYYWGETNSGARLRSVFVTSSVAYQGSHSAYINLTEDRSGVVYSMAYIPPSTTFTASIYATTTNPGGNAEFIAFATLGECPVTDGPNFKFYNFSTGVWDCVNFDDFNAPYLTGSLMTDPAGWSRYSATATSPNTSDYHGEIIVWYGAASSTPSGGGFVYEDAAQLEYGSIVTTYDPGTTDGGTAFTFKSNQSYNNWVGNQSLFTIKDNADKEYLKVLGDGTLQVGGPSIAGSLSVYQNTTSAPSFTVTKYGAVGVGIETPMSIFHVYANQNDFEYMQMENASDGTQSSAGMNFLAGGSAGYIGVISPNFYMSTTPNANYYQNLANKLVILGPGLQGDSDGVIVQGDKTIEFYTDTLKPSGQRMVINQIGDVVVNNNLGIGNATPTYKLDIKAFSEIGTVAFNTYTPSGINDAVISGTFTGPKTTYYYIAIMTTTPTDGFMWGWSEDGGVTYTSGGWNIPVASGTIHNLNYGLSVTFSHDTGHGMSSTLNYGDTWSVIPNVTDPFIASNAANQTVLYVGNDQKVGIGTSSPISDFHIQKYDDTGWGVGQIIQNTNTTTGNGSYAWLSLAVGPMTINPSAGTFAYNGGHIYASLDISNNWGQVQGLNLATGTSTEAIGFIVGDAVHGAGTGPAMMITSTGQVLIGTTTVTSSLKFKVAGHVGATAYCDENGENCFYAATDTPARIVTTTPVQYVGDFSYYALAHGKHGYDAGNEICKSTYPGFHFCFTGEIINIIRTQGAANFNTFGTSGWIAEGPPGYTANSNDCLGYTESSTSMLGAWWEFSISGGGMGKLVSCGTPISVSCCK